MGYSDSSPAVGCQRQTAAWGGGGLYDFLRKSTGTKPY
ncbi:hypothetical protein BN938_0191 [Mucinivorans hirudinis]|uniref:Uncharacterized protein n=1 Tax=Mucinivorans hirudinis TaxID=1433126 RepID=A0A060R603_9BACT|nr:hypothetical protein BN938_0191 [Mucinivorans hirudinis]